MNNKDLGRRSKTSSESNSLRQTELTGVKLGQKHQVSVRLESVTLEKVERIQQADGISFAEAVRKLVRLGLSKGNFE